jgi:hypothetical protein
MGSCYDDRHMLDDAPEDLVEFAEAECAVLEAEMQTIAARISPGKTWREVCSGREGKKAAWSSSTGCPAGQGSLLGALPVRGNGPGFAAGCFSC